MVPVQDGILFTVFTMVVRADLPAGGIRSALL